MEGIFLLVNIVSWGLGGVAVIYMLFKSVTKLAGKYLIGFGKHLMYLTLDVVSVNACRYFVPSESAAASFAVSFVCACLSLLFWLLRTNIGRRVIKWFLNNLEHQT